MTSNDLMNMVPFTYWLAQLFHSGQNSDFYKWMCNCGFDTPGGMPEEDEEIVNGL